MSVMFKPEKDTCSLTKITIEKINVGELFYVEVYDKFFVKASPNQILVNDNVVKNKDTYAFDLDEGYLVSIDVDVECKVYTKDILLDKCDFISYRE